MKKWIALSLVATACAASTEDFQSSVAAEKGLPTDPPPDTVSEDPNAGFHVIGTAGKCIAWDARNSRLELATCADVPGQRVRVVEYTARIVELRMGANQCVEPLLGLPLDHQTLTLSTCTGVPTQRWLLDGDSIRLWANADGRAPALGEMSRLVIAVRDHQGSDGSPLAIVDTRRDESDYWEFVPEKGAPRFPTSGFVEVTTGPQLEGALTKATPGTVVEVARGSVIDLTNYCRLPLNERVTLRGDGEYTGRRPLQPTARVFYWVASSSDPRYVACLAGRSDAPVFVAQGEGARFTNLILQGPSTSTDAGTKSEGIITTANQVPSDPELRIDVDHSDIFGWQAGAVTVYGGETAPREACITPRTTRPPVSVQRNYIHANRKDGSGYGISVSGNGRANAVGNTFMGNRHAITASGNAGQTYLAWDNLVLFSSPKEGFNYNQDFDVHGTGYYDPALGLDCRSPHWMGGTAGELIDIEENTFLGDNRQNFLLRGAPCVEAIFRHNVTRQQGSGIGDNAVEVKTCADPQPVALTETANDYDISDPTATTSVGDFNGDGVDDLFLATGAAFYVSFSGKTTWRFRAAGPERLGALRFGDFDGDRRTDVLRKNDALGRLEVRWGGEGDWMRFSDWNVALGDLVVGDFDGDQRADLLELSGAAWTMKLATGSTHSWSGTNPLFTVRAKDIRVGRFDAGATDDVVLESEGDWWFLPGGLPTSVAQLLGPARDSFAKVRFADVDGDGISDAVRVTVTLTPISVFQDRYRTTTDFSPSARFAFTNARTTDRYPATSPDTTVRVSPLGRFDAKPGADLLIWRDDRRLDLRSGAIAPLVLHSYDDGATKNEMY